jgi:transposase
MNAFPGTRSVLVLDNRAIHHGQEVVELFEEHGESKIQLKRFYNDRYGLRPILSFNLGCRLEYLPPYSPGFNPIEESFSCLKAFIRRQRDFLYSDNPIGDIVWAAEQCIDSKKCMGSIKHAGYDL